MTGDGWADLVPMPDDEPAPAADVPPSVDIIGRPDGAALLDDVETFHRRLVAYPSEAARVAAVLWDAHTHALDSFESTPRLAYLSPEPGSGKTRALEVHATLVPAPMHAVNATPAALFRAVADSEQRPTLLYDEIDTVFGPKAKENEEQRALLNAGHRRAGVAYRCVGEGTRQRVVAFPAYAALTLAGLGDLPDTIMSRAVIIRMRRRAPAERIEAFRARFHEPQGHALRDRLAGWAAAHAAVWAEAIPDMPDGVTDRPADVWEPLLAVADSAGGDWPDRARAACQTLTAPTAATASLGIQLLADARTVFGLRHADDEGPDVLRTEDILTRLRDLPEAPWADLRGKPLDSRGLAYRLRRYEAGPTDVKVAGKTYKGYRREDLWDAWQRYLPPLPQRSATSATGEPKPSTSSGNAVADEVADGTLLSATRDLSATAGKPLTSTVAEVAEVADLRGKEAGPPFAAQPGAWTDGTPIPTEPPEGGPRP